MQKKTAKESRQDKTGIWGGCDTPVKKVVFVFVTILIYSFIYLFAFQPKLHRIFHPPQKPLYTGCLEQLSNVKTGIESYISEEGSLDGMNSPEDVCHLIYPGYEKATECKGEVRKRIDARKTGVCLEGTLRFKRHADYGYEIMAISKEKKNCKICVTEETATPENYDECGGPFKCVHRKQPPHPAPEKSPFVEETPVKTK